MIDSIFDGIKGPHKVSLDFESLRKHGLELVQKMTGDMWTDYNLHDPGVTILEMLCYALTDLAYQTDFDIKDLLADKEGNIDYSANSFFLRQHILTSSPITEIDFRKAIIDQVTEIDQVWLTPVCPYKGENAMLGLYKVVAQVNKNFAIKWLEDKAKKNGNSEKEKIDARYKKEIADKVRGSFVSKRNLCEDIFDEVIVLDPVEILIKAEIQIGAHINPEQLLAQIYLVLENAVNKPVTYLTEEEVLQQGYTIDQVYCGPLLKNGLISDDDLKERATIIDATDIIPKVSNIDGVMLVRSLELSASNTGKFEKILKPGESEFYFLNIDGARSLNINLFVDKYNISVQKTLFAEQLKKTIEAGQRNFVRSLYQAEQKLTGIHRDTSTYYSIQNYFPLVYGIGQEGLLSSVSEERKAQAKQLKAYLMLFEQILANYLAQLDHVGTFFSNKTDEQDNQSYFAGPLYDVPHANEIISGYPEDRYPKTNQGWEKFKADPSNPYVKALNGSLESDAVFDDRKNRLLDHLLARFNEVGVTYPVVFYNRLYGTGGKTDRISAEIEWKSGVLKDFERMNYNRTRGVNYLSIPDKDYNFESKMRKLLYIEDDKKSLTAVFDPGKIRFDKTYIANVKSDIPQPDDTRDEADWGTVMEKVILNKKEINDLIEDDMLAGAESKHTESFVFMNRDISVLKDAININNYRIGPDPYQEGDYLMLFRASNSEKWNIISRYSGSTVPGIATLRRLIVYLRDLSIGSEGFYLVEHLLLRPDVKHNFFGLELHENSKVLLKHKEWLSFSKREEKITQLLNISPDAAFTFSQINRKMASDNTSLLKDAQSWIIDNDQRVDFLKKGDQSFEEARDTLDQLTRDLEALTGQNPDFADIKTDAEKNKEIAKKNKGIVDRLTIITNDIKRAKDVILSINDRNKAHYEIVKSLKDCYSVVNNLLKEANDQEKTVRERADKISKDRIKKLSEEWEINNTGGDQDYLMELFENIGSYGKRSSPRLKMLVRGKDGRSVDEDFFSFHISVIFPEWPARFQDEGFKTCVERLFKYNAPANINIHIKWLSIEEMKAFEPLYSAWKKELAENNKHTAAEDLLAFLSDHNKHPD
jgi:hypothetical protein